MMMVELRWKQACAGTYYDGLLVGTEILFDPVLQYRRVVDPFELDPQWSEWEDVPTVTVDDNA